MSKNTSAGKRTGVENQNPEAGSFYTRLVVSPYKRRALATYFFIGFCMFLSLTFNNMLGGRGWLVILAPVVIIGLIMTLIPKSEEWEYKAWQSQPRQIERHQVERK